MESSSRAPSLDKAALLREPPRPESFQKIMANTKSAGKRARQTAKRSLRNRSILTQLRNMKKRTRSSKVIDRAQAGALISAIDKAAKRGTIHRNAANRSKARLARAMAAAAK